MDKSSFLEIEYEPPLSRGIVSPFNAFVETLHKLSTVASFRDLTKDHAVEASELEQISNAFESINENAQDKECNELISMLNDVPNDLWNDYERNLTKSSLSDFIREFEKIRDLIARKLVVPLKLWKQVKKDAIEFPEVYQDLEKELEELKNAVKKVKTAASGQELEKTSSRKDVKKLSASEDFKSLHPFFLTSNAEEHMETLRIIKEKKLQAICEQENMAAQRFLTAQKKHKEQINSIKEETVCSKAFNEWLESWNWKRMEDYDEKIKNTWAKLSEEIEQSRKLCALYGEKNFIYMEIEKAKKEKERQEKSVPAAILIQNYWRGYMARKRLKEESDD